MPVRHLYVARPWADALSRLAAWPGQVALCWAAVRSSPAGPWEILGITVRGQVEVPHQFFEYAELGLWSETVAGRSVAGWLAEGSPLTAGTRPLEAIPENQGQAWWLTSGATYGMTGPIERPSYYFAANLQGAADRINLAKLSEPAFGPHQPYYPSREHALLEVLYGVTPDQGRRDSFNQVVIHLPYPGAYIEGADYVDDEGYVVRIGESAPSTAPGHEVQAVWKLHRAERGYQRGAVRVAGPGHITFKIGAEPIYFAASLQDAAGQLIDTIDVEKRGYPEQLSPLPTEALSESFDFLAAVWRERTGHRLLQLRRVSPAAHLALPVVTRSDFQSRVSDIANVMQAIAVDDSLVDSHLVKGMGKDATLGRLRVALTKLLDTASAEEAAAAIRVLQDVIRLRAALQHAGADTDLPTALRRLGIEYPTEWATAWETVRHRVVSALRELRQALESNE